MTSTNLFYLGIFAVNKPGTLTSTELLNNLKDIIYDGELTVKLKLI